MNILLMLAHSIEEHDQLRLLHSLGYNVFSLGGYIDPSHPHDPKRPALPGIPTYADLKSAVDNLGTEDNLEYAKREIPQAILDWADVIICHHYEWKWLWPQWSRIRDKRVIWRTVGQSTEANERTAAPYRAEGLQVVRYSPKEANIPGYAGADALIRFYKDPEEWHGWTGTQETVINITQHLMQRGSSTNGGYWKAATDGLQSLILGPGSHEYGGPGELTLEEMHAWLRAARCYLYTGTQPASYTLGLVEAMMTGIPVVSIGPAWHSMFPYGPLLFEGHELTGYGYNHPMEARLMLQELLSNPANARDVSLRQHAKAMELFSMERVGAAWKDFLG
jgi:glycosyltransferase involved in cell wall biosynthesis